MSRHLHRLIDAAMDAPGLRHLRERRFDAAFAAGERLGMCRGVHGSMREAEAAAPRTLPSGYDHETPARLYRERMHAVYPSDYPMMLWLQRLLAQGARRVVDLGGHIGVSYYAYRRFLPYPEDLRWQVYDVPAVREAGRRVAERHDDHGQLSFADDFAVAADADVLFTSGCVQYLEETLAQKLTRLARKPRWVMVNLLPLHERFDFWTVQSIVGAFCPYRIQRTDVFFDCMKEAGYRELDRWPNLEKRCEVAFDRPRSLDRYVGAAFERLS